MWAAIRRLLSLLPPAALSISLLHVPQPRASAGSRPFDSNNTESECRLLPGHWFSDYYSEMLKSNLMPIFMPSSGWTLKTLPVHRLFMQCYLALAKRATHKVHKNNWVRRYIRNASSVENCSKLVCRSGLNFLSEPVQGRDIMYPAWPEHNRHSVTQYSIQVQCLT